MDLHAAGPSFATRMEWHSFYLSFTLDATMKALEAECLLHVYMCKIRKGFLGWVISNTWKWVVVDSNLMFHIQG